MGKIRCQKEETNHAMPALSNRSGNGPQPIVRALSIVQIPVHEYSGNWQPYPVDESVREMIEQSLGFAASTDAPAAFIEPPTHCLICNGTLEVVRTNRRCSRAVHARNLSRASSGGLQAIIVEAPGGGGIPSSKPSSRRSLALAKRHAENQLASLNDQDREPGPCHRQHFSDHSIRQRHPNVHFKSIDPPGVSLALLVLALGNSFRAQAAKDSSTPGIPSTAVPPGITVMAWPRTGMGIFISPGKAAPAGRYTVGAGSPALLYIRR